MEERYWWVASLQQRPICSPLEKEKEKQLVTKENADYVGHWSPPGRGVKRFEAGPDHNARSRIISHEHSTMLAYVPAL